MSGSVSEIRQIHDWFLHRGLPLVLTRRLRSRALIARSAPMPLLMLTVVVYFTGELWQLAARMARQRLWQTIGFLAVVVLKFMIATRAPRRGAPIWNSRQEG